MKIFKNHTDLCMYQWADIRRSENDLQELVLSSHYVVHRDQTTTTILFLVLTTSVPLLAEPSHQPENTISGIDSNKTYR